VESALHLEHEVGEPAKRFPLSEIDHPFPEDRGDTSFTPAAKWLVMTKGAIGRWISKWLATCANRPHCILLAR
jgi:hypothetical protein